MSSAPIARAKALAGLALVLAAWTVGCITVNVQAYAKPEAGLGLEPGDRVVALWRNGFWEATVVTVQGKLVTVAWDTPPPDESRVPRGWVQRLDAHPEATEGGRWLLCPGAKAWQLCYLQAAEGERLSVLSTEDGRARRWLRDEVLELPEEVEGWAARYGQRVLEQLAFQDELARLVPATAGQAVVPEDRVLARWQDGNWWTAHVKAFDEGSVTVAWADGSPDSVLRAYQVAPVPDQVPTFRPGDLAFCLWHDDGRWWQARVDRVGQGRLEVTFADGTVDAAAPSSCVPGRMETAP